MARISYSPIVSDISGSVGDTTFSKWKGRSYIRQRVVPSNPQTAAQTEVRDAMTETVALWQALNDAITGHYDAGVSGQPLSGYNSFVQLNRTAIQNDAALEGPKRPPGLDPTLLPVPADLAAATGSGSGEVDITWTDPASIVTENLGVIVYNETSDVLAFQQQDAAAMSAETLTVDGIEAGADVTIACFAYDSDLDAARHADGLTSTAGS